MPADVFIDTNILLYAASTDPNEVAKRERAREILALPDWGLSIQVLQELYVNLIRPNKVAMAHADALHLIRQLLRRPVVVTDQTLLLEAIRIRDRFQVSYWDAAIIAAARTLGASVLMSEDFNHGQDFDGVRVQDPFRHP